MHTSCTHTSTQLTGKQQPTTPGNILPALLPNPTLDRPWRKRAKTLEVLARGVPQGCPSAITFTQILPWSLWKHLPGANSQLCLGSGNKGCSWWLLDHLIRADQGTLIRQRRSHLTLLGVRGRDHRESLPQNEAWSLT